MLEGSLAVALLWELLRRLPAQLLLGFFVIKLIDMRHPARFMVIWTVCLFIVPPLRILFEGAAAGLSTLVIVVEIALVVAMAQGPMRERFFVALAIQVIALLGELAASALWVVLAPESLYDVNYSASHPLESVLMLGCCVLAWTICFFGLYRFRRRAQRLGRRSFTLLLLFALLQFALLAAIAFAAMFLGDVNVSLTPAMALFSVVCFVADLMLFTSMERLSRQQAAQQQAHALQARLDAQKAQAQEFMEQVGALARFRHDYRNQLQVVLRLMEEGKVADAQRLFDQVLQNQSSLAPEKNTSEISV